MSRRLLGVCALLGAIVALTLPAVPAADQGVTLLAEQEDGNWRDRVGRSLLRPVTIDFLDTPLEDAVAYLSQVSGEPIRLDTKVLEDVGIPADEPITFPIKNMSVRSALNVTLRDLDLTWILRDEVILVTTEDEAANHLNTKVYDVADILRPDLYGPGAKDESPTAGQPGPYDFDFDALIDLIVATIDPESWNEVGGSGSVYPYGAGPVAALAFSQTDKIHEKVGHLLATIREMNESKTPNRIIAAVSNQQKAARRKADAAMQETVDLEFIDMPLSDIAEYLAEQLGLPVVFDTRMLEDCGIATDEPITFQCKGITVEAALGLMLSDLAMAWVVRDEVVLLTARDEAYNMLEVRVYDVTDLLKAGELAARTLSDPENSDPENTARQDFDKLIEKIHATIDPVDVDSVRGDARAGDVLRQLVGGYMGPYPPGGGQRMGSAYDFDALVDLVVRTLDPESWDEVGGPGSLQPWEGSANMLVCSQTADVHDEVARLFAAMREINRSKTPNLIVAAVSDEQRAMQRKADAAMQKAIDFEFVDTPLDDVAEYITEMTGVPVALDIGKLEDVGIAADYEPLTLHGKGITVEAALELMLGSLQLQAVVREEGVLLTTEDEAQYVLEVRVYDVTDLVQTGESVSNTLSYSADATENNKATINPGSQYNPFGEPEDDPFGDEVNSFSAQGDEGPSDVLFQIGGVGRQRRFGGVMDSGYANDFDALIDIVVTTIDMDSWDEVGGPGSIQPFEGPVNMLVCSQTAEVHDEMARLFAALRTARREKPKDSEAETTVSTPRPITLSTAKPTAARELALKGLSRKVQFTVLDTPLCDVVDLLADVTGVPIFLDRYELMGNSIAYDEPVTFEIKDVTLRSALELMLRPLDLSWTVTDAGLVITVPEEAECRRFVKVYDVSDLPSYRTAAGLPVTDFDELIDLLTCCIDPVVWDSYSGPGPMQCFSSQGIQVLVFSHTFRVHEQMEDILNQLRDVRGGPPTAQQIAALPPIPKPRTVPMGRGTGRGIVFGPRGPYTVKLHSPPPPSDVAGLNELVTGNNRFAIDLYAKLRNRDKGNLFVSPYSISAAMAMTKAGARGDTAAELARALHLTVDDETLHKAFGGLSGYLTESAKATGCELRMANRLWGQQGDDFLEPFLTTTREQYGAELGRLDFAQSENARQTINTWIGQQTAGHIPELLSPGDIDGYTRLVLTNAVYFNGRWALPFQKAATRKAVFDTGFNMGAGKVDVSMMFDTGHYDYAQNEELQILKKSYVGGQMSMVILLPKNKPGALASLEMGLSAEKLDSWISQLNSTMVEVRLPKFTFRTKFELSQAMKNMGVHTLFDMKQADLSGMLAKPELHISKIVHEAWVDVDEVGTEAAAATAMVGAMGGMGGPKPPVFWADHPFLFLIRDDNTGTILFLGRVVRPSPPQMDAGLSPTMGGMF